MCAGPDGGSTGGEIDEHELEDLGGALWRVVEPTHGAFEVLTVALEAPRYAAFRWTSRPNARVTEPGASTLVEFFLSVVGDAVELRVVESGFAALSSDLVARRRDYEANASGWPLELRAAEESLLA